MEGVEVFRGNSGARRIATTLNALRRELSGHMDDIQYLDGICAHPHKSNVRKPLNDQFSSTRDAVTRSDSPWEVLECRNLGRDSGFDRRRRSRTYFFVIINNDVFEVFQGLRRPDDLHAAQTLP